MINKYHIPVISLFALVALGLILFQFSTGYAQKATVTKSQSPASESLGKSLVDQVLLPDINAAIDAANVLITQLSQDKQTAPAQKDLTPSFSQLIKYWKQIQTAYIAGDLNEKTYDTPRYIDIFHHGNEILSEQLTRILSTDTPAKTALFKHSFKSINALEYLLFNETVEAKISPRTQQLAIEILTTLINHLTDIQSTYQYQSNVIIDDEVLTNSLILNALINSTYKLREWRIGDAAGLSRKYQGKPDNRRQEYLLSQQ